MPTSTEDLVATLADRYTVQDALGVGGMATVYRARDLRHERDVALKVLHPDVGETLGREPDFAAVLARARAKAAAFPAAVADA